MISSEFQARFRGPDGPSFSLNRSVRHFILPFLVLALPCALSADKAGKTHVDVKTFSAARVLDNGRKKPLDTYARHLLLQLSGRQGYQARSASEWLARLLFTPEKTRDDLVFMVNNMEVINAMGLDLKEARRFSYAQLEKGLPKLQAQIDKLSKVQDHDPVQKEMMRLYHNINSYIRHASCFQFAIPQEEFVIHDEALARFLELEPAPYRHSYFQLFRNAARLHQVLTAVQDKPDTALSGFEREAVNLTRTMYHWSKYYAGMPVLLIPTIQDERETWLSPWDALNTIAVFRLAKEELGQLDQMVRAYHQADQAGFDAAALKFRGLVRLRPGGSGSERNVWLEMRYNQYQPFLWAKFLCLTGLIFAMTSLLGWRTAFYRAALAFAGAALVPLSLGIAARMLIMGRPPVTDLYESLIAVSWMCMVLGLAMEILQNRSVGLLTAGFSGLSLLMIAEKYALEGDTLGMLVAVLNSKFWLSTHVITISMGYAGCCAAAVAGHLYLLRKMFSPGSPDLKETAQAIYGLLGFGLVFTFLGTILGGIWADQSWGRFWGWDPKENGSLIVVLWCALLFHARLGGLIRETGIAAGSILAAVAVMLAWFGVNLLGIGLHTYGFSSGALIKLVVYISVELVFIGGALGWIEIGKKKEERGKKKLRVT